MSDRVQLRSSMLGPEQSTQGISGRNLPSFGIVALSKLIRAKELSPVELFRDCFSRIEAWNSELNAFATVVAGDGFREARLAEEEIRLGRWRGPLHGIPVGIKDLYDTAGIRTTAGTGRFLSRVPILDAEAVTSLRKAGAILMGKTNMHEMGMGTTGLESCFGPTRNPWNRDHISGGSSSGSAVAVATGMCLATLDTDAIGSCRLPASCCGVVGFKGTYGLISTAGILGGESPLDESVVWLNHAGITAQYVDDVALVLRTLQNEEGGGPPVDPGGSMRNGRLRVGVLEQFNADAEVRAGFEKAVELILGLGHFMSMKSIRFTETFLGLQNIQADRGEVQRKVFTDVDVLILPTTTTTVPAIKEVGDNPLALSPENTLFANYYGLPAMTVPCGFDKNRLPLGLQIVAKPWHEPIVFQLAAEFESMARRVFSPPASALTLPYESV